ncbi:MAG: Dyp-type peroxidase [Chitinophagaceae bacterium]
MPELTTDEQLLDSLKLYTRDTATPDFELLRNLQSHILVHHGRDYAWHVLLKFDKANKEEWRKSIAGYAAGITAAFKQHVDIAKRKLDKTHDGGIVKGLYLSMSGYKALGLDDIWAAQENNAFAQGMAKRANMLGDPVSEEWEVQYARGIDLMILLADDKQEDLEMAMEEVKKVFAGCCSAIDVQKGEMLRNDAEEGIEHFGYVDGISQPQFLASYQPGTVYNDAARTDILLVEDPGRLKGNCYGSFLVFRKLEQNVKGFKEREEELGAILFPNLPKGEEDQAEIAGAYVVGRFENGTPVTMHNEEDDKNTGNEFDYTNDTAGNKCPFFSHIRLVNPRSTVSEIREAIPGYEAPQRITRRGIPYDEAGRNGDLDKEPETGVGLLFMAFQSSIENGFEKMQRSANRADGIIGHHITNGNQQWPISWGRDKLRLCGFSFSGFVTLKGGEYFYAPSIPFLLQLADGIK